jgi:hypothetical protein
MLFLGRRPEDQRKVWAEVQEIRRELEERSQLTYDPRSIELTASERKALLEPAGASRHVLEKDPK